MKYFDFLAKVQERGEYESRDDAERVTRIVLAVLGLRLTGDEAGDLAAQLPDQMSDVLLVQLGGVSRSASTRSWRRSRPASAAPVWKPSGGMPARC